MTNTANIVLSRQVGLAKEMNTIANNIANSSTTGFRRDAAIFSEYVSALDSGAPSISQTRVAGQFIDNRSGGFIKTGGALDVAIEGDGYFVVNTPGGERLTRAGSFLVNAQGELTTPEGFQVSGAGGAAISLPQDGGSITIGADGIIANDGAPVGQFRIANADPTTLSREGNNLLKSTEAFTDIETSSVRQGFLENSNVNAIIEIGRMIEVQRAFELGQQLINDDNERIRRTIERIGQSQ